MRTEKNGGLHAGDRRASRLLRAVRIVWCAGACGVVAGAADGAAFQVNLIDAGGVVGGSLGSPITWSGGAAFNPGGQANTPPDQSAAPGNPNAPAFLDSYVAIDPIGPSFPESASSAADGYTALGPSNIIGPTAPTTIFQTDRLTGVWFNAGANGGFVTSGVGPSGLDRMFIAQISLRPSSSDPATQGLMVNIKDAGTLNSDGELGALRFGAASATNNNGKWGQSYYLDFTRSVTIHPVQPFPPPSCSACTSLRCRERGAGRRCSSG